MTNMLGNQVYYGTRDFIVSVDNRGNPFSLVKKDYSATDLFVALLVEGLTENLKDSYLVMFTISRLTDGIKYNLLALLEPVAVTYTFTQSVHREPIKVKEVKHEKWYARYYNVFRSR